MTDFPKSTAYKKIIPKQKLYSNADITDELKKNFIRQIKKIVWRNKIADTTVNIAKGSYVTEIEIFGVSLSGKEFDENILRQIDKAIPYHIVFILEYEGKYQARIGYKEQNEKNSTFKVSRYFQTEWLMWEELPLNIDGMNLDTVYENFVRQIAGKALFSESEETLKTTIERNQKRTDLEKRIALLQKKISREKQFNKKIELKSQLKVLIQQLEEC